MITIEMFPAGNGDAILLCCDQQIILIDGGYTSTYKNHLKPRLKELSAQGYRLSRFVVTHIDADHISGAISFIEDNGPADQPKVIGIDEVWFNSYRHLQFDDKEKGAFAGAKPPLIIKGGMVSANADDAGGLVGYPQGTSLGSLLLQHGYAWNASFKGQAVKTDQPGALDLGGGLMLTLLGPTTELLNKLGAEWREYLAQRFKGKLNEDAFFDDAFELMTEEKRQLEAEAAAEPDEEKLVAGEADWVLASQKPWGPEDRSETNGSSIIFLIEYKGKKLLFLGDAIPGQVESQLKKYSAQGKLPLQLDVLKVAHHGAWPNNSPALIKMLNAQYYLISTNGLRHHHPHLSTLATILETPDPNLKKIVAFNYKQGTRLSEMDVPAAKTKYHYEVLWPEVDEWGNGRDGYFKLELP